MVLPQQGSIDGSPQQRANQDGERQNSNGGPDVNGSIRSANGVASSFLTEVKGIEKELLAENLQLTVTIALRDATIGVLNTIITFLKTQVANKPDCEEDDEIKFKSDAELAGDGGFLSSDGLLP